MMKAQYANNKEVAIAYSIFLTEDTVYGSNGDGESDVG